jgi:endonuclease-3
MCHIVLSLFFNKYKQKMTKKERVAVVIDTLEELFPNPAIPLDHINTYTFLIAVLMSAQTTDAMVNRVTPELFRMADNPYDMVKHSVDEIYQIIRKVGLAPRKSKAIYDLSHILIDKYNGKVPDTFEGLESLPGVGHKTASVLMSQAFGVPAFPVDTHIHRLMKQWKLSQGKNVVQVEKDAKRLFPKEKWNDIHLQIIYYGRQYAPARGYKPENDIIMLKLFA